MRCFATRFPGPRTRLTLQRFVRERSELRHAVRHRVSFATFIFRLRLKVFLLAGLLVSCLLCRLLRSWSNQDKVLSRSCDRLSTEREIDKEMSTLGISCISSVLTTIFECLFQAFFSLARKGKTFLSRRDGAELRGCTAPPRLLP